MALPKDVDFTDAKKVLTEASKKVLGSYADYTRMNSGMPQLIDDYKRLVILAGLTPPLGASNSETKSQ